MKILITGGRGQLAQALVETAPSHHVLQVLPRKALDISDTEACAQKVKAQEPDYIINTAAYNQVDLAEKEPENAYAVNAEGPKNLALAANQVQARLIHISTDFVFSGSKGTPYLITDPQDPVSVYGKSKAEGEKAVLSVSDKHLILRTAWLYSASTKNFLTIIFELLKSKPELNVVVDQVGTPTSVLSLARAIWRAVERPEVCGIHHLSDAGVASRYDFAWAIRYSAVALGLADQVATLAPINNADFPQVAKRPACSVLDKSATWQALEIKPQHWQDALYEIMKRL